MKQFYREAMLAFFGVDKHLRCRMCGDLFNPKTEEDECRHGQKHLVCIRGEPWRGRS